MDSTFLSWYGLDVAGKGNIPEAPAVTDPIWLLWELRAGIIFSISSHKLGRTSMEIGSTGKVEHIEKGFYGESVDEEELIYSGIRFHSSQQKAWGGGQEGRKEAHCGCIWEKSWPERPTLLRVAEDGDRIVRVGFLPLSLSNCSLFRNSFSQKNLLEIWLFAR